MPATRPGRSLVLAAALAALVLLAPPQARTSETPSGTFRFLTQDLPRGTTNGTYTVRLLTVNAAGPVTYASNPAAPAPGLTLDPGTGIITGAPTEVNSSGFDVTIEADDGWETIELVTKLRVNASGGGGNAGASLSTDTLPDGRVGQPYAASISAANTIGPVIFGATDLPPGLTLNGATGALSGAPTDAGTFYATLSVTDRGENDNKVFTILPILVLPQLNDFAITNTVLVNGEVGSAFLESITVENATGNVTYSGSGLPAALAVDSDSGELCGTPAEAGLFLVRLFATDAQATVGVNLPLWIAPGAASSFYWVYFGLPAGIVDVPFGRQPPIEVRAENGDVVTYAATGLPAGLTYNATTGELAGTPTDAGVYPVILTATDATSAETIRLAAEIVVLPPGGGDASAIPVNLWVLKSKLKTGDGDGSWSAKYLYNADRRPESAFDAATEAVRLTMGSRAIDIAPDTLTDKRGKLSFSSERGETPLVKVTVDPRKQSVVLKTKKDVIADQPPAILRSDTVIGARGFRQDLGVGDDGVFRPTAGFHNKVFVVSKAQAKVKGPAEDQLKLSFLLADPAFAFEAAATIRLRVLQDGVVLVDRTFSDLVEGSASSDGNRQVYVLKRGPKDAAATDVVKKFKLTTASGKGSIVLTATDLGALADQAAHVGVELTIGERTYFTRVTVFEDKPGRYKS